MKLWKTTIVIWSEFDPKKMEIHELAEEAIDGAAYCSVQETFLCDPWTDNQADDGVISFFNVPEEGEESEV